MRPRAAPFHSLAAAAAHSGEWWTASPSPQPEAPPALARNSARGGACQALNARRLGLPAAHLGRPLRPRRSRLLSDVQLPLRLTSSTLVSWMVSTCMQSASLGTCAPRCAERFARHRGAGSLQGALPEPACTFAACCRALRPSRLVPNLMHVCRDPAPPCRCLLGVVRRVFSCFGRACRCLGGFCSSSRSDG